MKFDLQKPPAVETSLGFYFPRVAGWNILHFGALWGKFREKYPITEFPAPVIPNLGNPPIKIEWNPSETIIPIRTCFTNADKTQLVQFQDNPLRETMFLHNWRKTEATMDYQHYDAVLPLFKRDWATFLEFLSEYDLPRPAVTRCELSYFNHIVRGEDWQEYADLPGLFRAWRGFDKDSVFKQPVFVGFNVVQVVGNGQISIAVGPAVRTTDGKEILQMNVTGVATVTETGDSSLFAGLAECHEIAIRGFRSFVTDEALLKWGANQ